MKTEIVLNNSTYSIIDREYYLGDPEGTNRVLVSGLDSRQAQSIIELIKIAEIDGRNKLSKEIFSFLEEKGFVFSRAEF